MGRRAILAISVFVLTAGSGDLSMSMSIQFNLGVAQAAQLTQEEACEILGIARNASPAEIKKAFRKLALKYHPDRLHAKADEESFKKIRKAYELLHPKQLPEQADVAPSRHSRSYSIDPETYREAQELAKIEIMEGGIGITFPQEANKWAERMARIYSHNDFELWSVKYISALRLALMPISEGGLGLAKDKDKLAYATSWAQASAALHKNISDFDAWAERYDAALKFSTQYPQVAGLPKSTRNLEAKAAAETAAAKWAIKKASEFSTIAAFNQWAAAEAKRSRSPLACFIRLIQSKAGNSKVRF
ncbi:MAG: J domain-containing protein [Bdellovibrionia bacterium]